MSCINTCISDTAVFVFEPSYSTCSQGPLIGAITNWRFVCMYSAEPMLIIGNTLARARIKSTLAYNIRLVFIFIHLTVP